MIRFISQVSYGGPLGFFQFQMENQQPTDLVSAEGIKVFRMENTLLPAN